jgi:mRNA-degrading endonuclease RelE of RelBE toxin-antitoxin system
MDSVQKLLRSITKKEASTILACIETIYSGNWSNLNIQKLKGYQDLYRIRVGKFRIFIKKEDGRYIITTIRRRSEKTYRDI